MDLVIDTSGSTAALAVVEAGRVLGEGTRPGGRDVDLAAWTRELVDPGAIDRVVVALGPGSFTGLRVGAAFGLGLALGRGLPLLGLDSLGLQAARALAPATAVVEAGRGRVYALAAGDTQPRLVDAGELAGPPVVGWLREATAARLRVGMLDAGRTAGFGLAAARLAGSASELGYDGVRIRYVSREGGL